MKLLTIVFLFFTTAQYTQGQNAIYNSAYKEISSMLSDSSKMSFKRAVFVTENAYLKDTLDFSRFENQIRLLARLALRISKQSTLLYEESDRDEISKYASVFKLMTDTVTFVLDSSKYFFTKPYQYDFQDFWGERDWTKMFVSRLLASNKGNCHSLPFLYKILVEELGGKAYLAMAPNHTYIKQWAKKTGWYNTELTSQYFPIDAWIMSSGYIHLNAVQNRIYMDTLSEKQSLAVCLVDLAKGYEREHSDDLDFIERCANKALQYYPNYVNALMLKAETTKKRFERIMKKHNAKYPADILNNPDGKRLFASMENQYSYIDQLGFRTMPKDMYLNWLADLRRERDKYGNKEIIGNLRSTDHK